MASKPESLPDLFNAVRAKFPSTLAPESWYLIAASALVTCSDPSNLGQLYKYLTNQPEHHTPEQRRALNKRLREFVMKQWVTVGAPKAAVALFGSIKEEQPGGADLSFTKSNVTLDAAYRARGTEFLRKIYGSEKLETMFQPWGADFEWLTKDVVYGMFHADDSVFDTMETELIMYTAIACEGLRTTVENHLEGLLRMGLSVEEIEGVTACAELVATWAGYNMSGWPNVNEVAASLR